MVRADEETGTLDPVTSLLALAAPGADVRVTSVVQRRWALLAAERFRAAVMGAFATVAYGLTLIGLGGVLASDVAARRREFAVRLALGAPARHVALSALHRGLVPVLAGLSLGLAGAAIATRGLATALHGLPEASWLTLAGTSIALACGAAAASVLPTRSALRVDPCSLMKDE